MEFVNDKSVQWYILNMNFYAQVKAAGGLSRTRTPEVRVF